MNLQGPQFYDNDGVFDIDQKRRQRAASPNDTLERPVIRELLGDVKAHDFLDLGCGDAAFGKELLAAGASSYLGVDGSRNMVRLAQDTLHGTRGQVIHADLQTWPFPEAGFSRVCSRLALHYLPELDATFRAVHRALRPGGRFVFSVEHPVITSCNEAMRDTALRQDWLVDNYFNTGQRVNDWMGASVIKYHRTIEDHFHALQCSGFRVEALRESRPMRQHFASEDDFVRRHRIPLFLFMTASKLTP